MKSYFDTTVHYTVRIDYKPSHWQEINQMVVEFDGPCNASDAQIKFMAARWSGIDWKNIQNAYIISAE